MRNPLRSEESAFRLVVWTIVLGAVLVLASRIDTWLGLAVFLAEAAAVAWWLTGDRRA